MLRSTASDATTSLFPAPSPALDAVLRRVLERELTLSAIRHDLGGSLTGNLYWAERGAAAAWRDINPSLERVPQLVAGLSEPWAREPVPATVAGVPVRVTGPIDVLRIAIDDLPHGAIGASQTADALVLRIEDVPRAESVTNWTYAQVRDWRAAGGPGFAGARLRIAARITGLEPPAFAFPEGGVEGTVTIRLPRG
jgi:hypothetical protein